MNDLKTLLNHLPYKLAAYDAQGNFLYDNGGADGSFFPREDENLPDWIMSEVLASPTKERSYQIPTDSFDQVLIQTYQAAFRQRIPFPHGNSQFSRNINSGSDIYSKRVFRKWSYHTV